MTAHVSYRYRLGRASGSDFLETEIQPGTGKRHTVYIDLSVIHNHLVPASVKPTVPNLMAVHNNVSVVMNGLVSVEAADRYRLPDCKRSSDSA